MKFFKKISPQIALQLAGGRALRFENVDGEYGILQTTNEEIIGELRACIKNDSGGVFEIDEAEYRALAEKKTTYRPRWRDELSKSGSAPRPLPTPSAAAVQSVADNAERFPEPSQAKHEAITAQQPPQYRPNAIPRT